MHGEGTLVWADQGGVCTYRGEFRDNIFEGHGVLEWSNGARYDGAFSRGLYHGEGVFEWPCRQNVYRGRWVRGEMSGHGTLTCGVPGGVAAGGGKDDPANGDPANGAVEACSYVYVGSFRQGHMEGKGLIKFHLPDNDI